MRSVDVRGVVMSLTLPLRLEDGVDGGRWWEVEVLGRGPRMEPVTERLSAAFVTREALEAAREGDVYGEWETETAKGWDEEEEVGSGSSSRCLPFGLPY